MTEQPLATPIDRYLLNLASQIEAVLDQLLFEKEAPQNSLYQAARYSVFSGGKRMRPLLTLATAEALSGAASASTKALYPAAAVELIHTYSLIHDDLPCMDDDDYRRGQLTLHRVVSEGQAVLTGDFLLTYAFEILAIAPNLTAAQKIALVQVLAKQSGAEGMIGGQVLDLAAEGKQLSLAQLQQVHLGKTAALMQAAMQMGAIVAEASSRQMQQLSHFAALFGLAFQIADDILDVVDSLKKHGKEVSSDIANHKATYVALLGLEGARQAFNDTYSQAWQMLAAIDGDTSLLQAVAAKLLPPLR